MLKRIAVLCSQRAPGLLYLLNRSADRGVSFEIVCVVTSEASFAEENRVERRGIPTLSHPIHGFPGSRRDYDAHTVQLIEPFMPDLVLLDGYLFLVTEPMLRAFPSRIVNLHFADLTLRQPDGSPRFPGIRAVRRSLAAGCTETRATVHLVDEDADAGPPIVLSWPFAVSPLVEELRTLDASDALKAYAYAHQQWMLRTVSGPLIAAALRLIASARIDLDRLSREDPARVAPWQLDRAGCLLQPDAAMATVAAR
ncbi:MAG TPA: formyltransferase family protein [Vicinamibacterales bacterium]|nr:formyltransferase family protein [Vicinamibacterales bacterium]